VATILVPFLWWGVGTKSSDGSEYTLCKGRRPINTLRVFVTRLCMAMVWQQGISFVAATLQRPTVTCPSWGTNKLTMGQKFLRNSLISTKFVVSEAFHSIRHTCWKHTYTCLIKLDRRWWKCCQNSVIPIIQQNMAVVRPSYLTENCNSLKLQPSSSNWSKFTQR